MKSQHTPSKNARRIVAFAACLLGGGAGLLQAQVPSLISYQGRVLQNGTNFDGTGQFKFAFVNNNGTVTFWSNNGSSVGGSQPSAFVSLPVANGLVMTLLGDTTLANMTAIPASVFANSDVRLRVWFNGGPGFQQLAPDQRIVSVGYAMRAETVSDGSITSIKLAPGAVTSNTLANPLAIGSTSVNGELDVYRTASGVPSIKLQGSSSQISTYGSDGLEQIRLWGPSYGEILLNNSLANNNTAVTLSANGSSGGRLLLANTNGSTRANLSGLNTGGSLTLYQADGNTGVSVLGDSGGAGFIGVTGTNGSTRASLDGSDGGGGALRLKENDGTETVTLTSEGNGALTLHQGDGTVGIGMSANNGTGGAGISVYSDTGSFAAQLTVADATHHDGYLGLASGGVNRLYARVWNGTTASAYLGMVNSAGSQTITLDADATGDGKITTQVLQITGGSDLSENFDIKSIREELRSGMIVCIDPENPGRLVTSTRAYDKSVAGVVSGAGGVKTGMLMGQKGTAADGKLPVALSGRVYCWVDAGVGAVKPGDLITTSDTPGHGMKVRSHRKAQGAIIGKAMSSLEKGRGLVLVLVSLQ